MRLVAMNIRHGGGDRVEKIAAFVASVSPHTLVLTEYRENQKGRMLRETFFAQGYAWQAAGSARPREHGLRCLEAAICDDHARRAF